MFLQETSDFPGSLTPQRRPGYFASMSLERMMSTYLDGCEVLVTGTLAAWARRSSTLDEVLCLVFTPGSASNSALSSALEQGGFLIFDI